MEKQQVRITRKGKRGINCYSTADIVDVLNTYNYMGVGTADFYYRCLIIHRYVMDMERKIKIKMDPHLKTLSNIGKISKISIEMPDNL